MCNGGFCGTIPKQLRIEVGMRINETRTDDFSGCIDFLIGLANNCSNFDNFIAFDCDIGGVSRRSGSIGNDSVSIDCIHGLGSPLA